MTVEWVVNLSIIVKVSNFRYFSESRTFPLSLADRVTGCVSLVFENNSFSNLLWSSRADLRLSCQHSWLLPHTVGSGRRKRMLVLLHLPSLGRRSTDQASCQPGWESLRNTKECTITASKTGERGGEGEQCKVGREHVFLKGGGMWREFNSSTLFGEQLLLVFFLSIYINSYWWSNIFQFEQICSKAKPSIIHFLCPWWIEVFLFWGTVAYDLYRTKLDFCQTQCCVLHIMFNVTPLIMSNHSKMFCMIFFSLPRNSRRSPSCFAAAFTFGVNTCHLGDTL